VSPAPRPVFAPIKYEAEGQVPSRLLEYFKKRGISAATLQDNKVTLVKDSIRLPYYKNGKVVNIKYRSIVEKKFYQTPGGEPCLYRFDDLSAGALVITEGEMDALALYETGIRNVTSIPNGAPPPNAVNLDNKFAFLADAAPLLNQCQKIILCTDGDTPGDATKAELIRRIGAEKCYTVTYPPGCKDANDVLKNLGAGPLLQMIDEARPLPIDGAVRTVELPSAGIYDNGVKRGLSTGWRTVDRLYTVVPGEFTVITGIPNHGKSEFVEALMVNMILNHKWRFGYFSPENLPMEQHLVKIIEKVVGMPALNVGLENPRMDRDTFVTAQEFLDDYLRFIYPADEDLSIDKILSIARQVLCQMGMDGLILDPWNEFEHRYGSMSEAQYLNQELGKIRRFARTNKIHVFLVAHPRIMRTVKDEYDKYAPPTMYDISGGAHWNNKADNGLAVHREDFNRHETTVHVHKIRHKSVGKKGKVVLNYCYDSGRYFCKGVGDQAKFA
jgi:twinkle protein